MPQRKAISPIIAIIIILLITIAIAGAGYSYISAYWTGMTGRQIEVINALCVQTGSQGKVMVKNIGTSPLDTGEIAVINPLTGEDITGDVLWAGRVSDPGLVLQLRFEEGSGTLARDTSGKGNDGTLEGDTAWVEGKVGKALSFDGVDDYVNVPADTSLNPYTAFSIGLWANIAAAGDVVIGTYGGNYRGFYLNGNSYLIGEGPSSNKYISCPMTINSWTHVVATYDGTNTRCYINGKLYSGPTAISAASWAGQALSMMKAGWYSSYVGGKIDEVRIYNRALEPDEIEDLAENSVLVQPGDTATMTHTCTGRCRYSLVLGGMAKEAMLQC